MSQWLEAVRADMANITPSTTMKDLIKPALTIPADAADRDFLEAAARVRAALILVVHQVKNEIVDYDDSIGKVFVNFCTDTDSDEVAYLNAIENRLRSSDTAVNICEVTSYPLYIWYVAANTSPDIPVSVDFGMEDAVRASLSEPPSA
jgi:hypothetical protein